jgi:hypothetical protein
MNWANAANSEVRLTITCGIDWAGSHHDVALVDGTGKLVAKRRISDDAEGLRRLLDLLAEAGDTAGDPIPVPVEAARGLLISCLRATGRAVYSINSMAVARYRERHRVARAKSDHADAMALANILRTDADVHRPLPADSGLPKLTRSAKCRVRPPRGLGRGRALGTPLTARWRTAPRDR